MTVAADTRSKALDDGPYACDQCSGTMTARKQEVSHMWAVAQGSTRVTKSRAVTVAMMLLLAVAQPHDIGP